MQAPDPIVSMDIKHKEFLGLCSGRAGFTRKRPRKLWTTIFPPALGVIYPHGCYDSKRNLGPP